MNEAVQQPRKRLRVLIADDTAAIRDSLSALVARIPDVQIVGLAETGTQALEMIRTLKPHVATLDIRMPEINGIKVLEALRKDKQELEIIVLTGLEETEYRKKCLSLGAKYFLHKATEFETVIEVLKDYAVKLNTPPLPPDSQKGPPRPQAP